MGMDRFISWGEPPEWGAPTAERIAAVAQDFLGDAWNTYIRSFSDGYWIVAETQERATFHLASERPEVGDPYRLPDGSHITRGFEIYFPTGEGELTSVITRYSDSFTNAVANRFTEIIARWWNGKIEWPS